MKFASRFFFLAFVLIFWTACEQDPFDILSNDPVFDMDLYEQNIKDAIEDQAIGYAYTINKDGLLDRSGADGFARTASNPPQTPQAHNKRMHVASLSKTITAVAVMRLLNEKGLSVNDKIAPYLPPDWVKGPGVNDLTFADLLSHKSGLGVVGTQNSTATRYDSLKQYIATGVTAPKTYNYSNSHFALFRVIIPFLWEVTPWAPGASLDQITADVYIYYVREEILKPIGINNAKVTNSENNATLYYSFPESAQGGAGANSDFTLTCGGFGWHLSSFDLANFIAHMYYDNSFLKAGQLELMEDLELGWFGNNGGKGTYYSHNGGWRYQNPAPTRGLRTCLIHFPNGTQTALVVNSRASLSSLSGILSDAYDKAWIEK